MTHNEILLIYKIELYASTKGLHLHCIARNPKLAALPTTSPPTRQNCAILAAVLLSYSSSLGFSTFEGAAMRTNVEACPFVNPNANRMSIYAASELIIGFEKVCSARGR